MTLLPDHQPFLTALLSKIEAQPGSLDHLFMDHICYRVETVEHYESLRDALLINNELLVEGIIGGRRISTFKLTTPLPYNHRQIPLLELPEPKAGSFYAEGFEHVEFVTDRPLPEFIEHLPSLLATSARDFDRKGLSKARNADLRVRLGAGLNVKFHERSLEEVIRREVGGIRH
jgi:predicted metalloenzyme YecM